ncbi:Transposase InsO and inactivated derivatives [Granulicatella balaenopterae]|uniref:Transposase InsO and inactivated derivatives n=1 Tax=Granulicatella balaenopterae TaxID=137733 RepID=A0A1H9MLL8_9LACT|nr:Transposase InsO and inactivated derivatives [Granulicatella balaenopterae]
MYWQNKFKSPEVEDPNAALEAQIIDIRKQHKNWGYRRICGYLKRLGQRVNHKRVQRIIKKLGLQVTSYGRKSRKYYSYKGNVGRTASNRVHRRFDTCIPHQKITTDTSEFKYYKHDSKGNETVKKLYLDPFMDLFNREIISYRIAPSPTAQNIMSGLNEAIEKTNDCPYRRTFHSDQGWGYQMHAYVDTLKKHKIFQSMSRKGNCHDNSVMENFFGILKQEIYYGRKFYSYEELESEINEFIKYYNEDRIKEKLDWMSPTEYRLAKSNCTKISEEA